MSSAKYAPMPRDSPPPTALFNTPGNQRPLIEDGTAIVQRQQQTKARGGIVDCEL